MSILKPFLTHPEEVGETYAQHLGQAFLIGLRMIGAGLACCIHAILPFLFVETASNLVHELHAGIERRHAGKHKKQILTASEAN